MRECAVCGISIDLAHRLALTCSAHCDAARRREYNREYYRGYYASNRERLSVVHARWNKAHSHEVNARKRARLSSDPAYREMMRDRARQDRWKRLAQKRAYRKLWRKNNPEKLAARKRANYENNREKHLEKRRLRRLKNQDSVRDYGRQYARECAAAVMALKELGFSECLTNPSLAKRVLRELELT